MLATFLLILGLSASTQANAPTTASAQGSKPAQTSSQEKIDPEIAAKLLKVKRIHVEGFGDDKESQQLQAMVINALVSTKRFIITENKGKADATLKGVGLEKTSQELHATGEATSVGAAAGGHSGSVSGSEVNGNGSISGSSSGGFAARHMGIEDSQASVTAVNDARIAVRLVSVDGDVLWSTTKESKGAKYKGASADVADEVVKQLMHDLEKLQPARN
jgi:curli biogenesis system outer membrane secretion channel CsgG